MIPGLPHGHWNVPSFSCRCKLNPAMPDLLHRVAVEPVTMHSHIRVLTALAILACIPAFAQAPAPAATAPSPAMVLTVEGFADGGQIPVRISQAAPGVAPGEGTSPAMHWTNVPAGTRSFVVNMRDLDVARNRTTEDQAHWVVWNIPGTATGMPEGVPHGSQLVDGSFQVSATGPMYRGPGAPATGPFHHYMFEVYALDSAIEVAATADAFETRANVMKAMQGHVLGKAVYGGLFRRPAQ
jgi:Raf kinase inhibitor-like YbhB/YbcL family protein